MARKDSSRQKHLSAAVFAAAVGGVAVPAHADMNLVDKDGFKVDAAVTLGVAAFASPNAQFGSGINSPTAAGGAATRTTSNPQWVEAFVKPELKAAYATSGAGTVYGAVSAVGALTRGDGDANYVSATYGNPERIAIEDAYLGWKSGTLFSSFGEDAIDLSGGRQSFKIADGFLVADGTADVGERASYWSFPRSAFKQTAIARVNTDPVRADVFMLKNDSSLSNTSSLDQPSTTLYGANVEWFQSAEGKDGRATYDNRLRYVGATFMRVYDALNDGNFSFTTGAPASVTNTLSANRDGLNIYSVHGGGSPIPGFEDFSLYGQYVLERNEDANRKVNANAWYLEPGYTFSQLPWTPKVAYRYSHFSGDGNPTDTTDKSYDPMFYSSVRGYGSSLQGEIVGQYMIFNSNVNVNMLNFSVKPIDPLKLSLIAYRFDWAEQSQFTNVTSSHAADEIDFIAEYTVSDNVSLAGTLAAAKAGDGGQQFLRNQQGSTDRTDQTWYLGEVSVVIKF
ncbi:MAG: alginate export family protein [Bacteroidota bacterium]